MQSGKVRISMRGKTLVLGLRDASREWTEHPPVELMRTDPPGVQELKRKQRLVPDANPLEKELGYYGNEPMMRISEAKSPAED